MINFIINDKKFKYTGFLENNAAELNRKKMSYYTYEGKNVELSWENDGSAWMFIFNEGKNIEILDQNEDYMSNSNIIRLSKVDENSI
jgi:hypothetical protein